MAEVINTPRVLVMGATSGMGREVASIYIERGYIVGVAGRRVEMLESLVAIAPERVFAAAIDVTNEDAEVKLASLIERMGGMDMYFHSSGIGHQNFNLNSDVELSTLQTNGVGFTRMIGAAFRYFADNAAIYTQQHRKARIVVISSIAGTKGLGVSPAYSATKRFQNTYIQSLAQLANMRKLPIRFTDIRPGFVQTALLNDEHTYPMMLQPDAVAREIVAAVDCGRRVRVIDWKYRILTFFWRLIPNYIWERIDIHTKK
ncbi:MAG: SDR family NAD(P)-dependent oxidoreductase [Bacteroidales bacterium]|jgi:short-subunit dehydrogenase|nr:SDR family NAD(P)-dependent oxidoreductase [Bacteroidales bacterium]